MSDNTASLNLPKDLIESIVRDNVTSQIAKQLIDSPRIAEALVSQALYTKVNSRGLVSSSDYENKFPFMEWLVGGAIREIAEKAVREGIVRMAPVIEEMAIKKMQSTKGKNVFVKMLVDAMMGNLAEVAQSKWNLTVKIAGDE